jgi:hypothetical protein
MRKLKTDQKGQTTIEFALTLLLLMGFVFFYFQLALVLGFGNYIQYATFMSARAYLASGPTQSDQQARALAVLTRMLQKSEGQPTVARFPSIVSNIADPATGIGPSEQFVDGSRSTGWMQGVRYTFRGRLLLLPLSGRKPASLIQAGAPTSGQPLSWQDLELTSESWLGREPSLKDCDDTMNGKGWYYDNGC